jgi:hypothetical protein
VHMALERMQVVEQTKLLLRLVGSQTNLEYKLDSGERVALLNCNPFFFLKIKNLSSGAGGARHILYNNYSSLVSP